MEKQIELGFIICDAKTGKVERETEGLIEKIVENRNEDIKIVNINTFDKTKDRITFFKKI